MAIKEADVICLNCAHSKVCKNKETFLNAQRAVAHVFVGTGNNSSVDIKDIPWIKPIQLDCLNYLTTTMFR